MGELEERVEVDDAMLCMFTEQVRAIVAGSKATCKR
jgi:hypothetical protein